MNTAIRPEDMERYLREMRVMDESGGEEPAAPEEEETPCVPCEAAAEDDGL